MILLYTLFCILFILVLLYIKRNRYQQLNIVWCVCFVVFILTGTRWEYGGDWDNYYGYFQQIKELRFDDTGFEVGWVLLTFIIKNLTHSYVAFQFLMAAVIFFCIFQSIKHLSPVPILTYFVFFSIENGGINYVRTAFVTCVIVYSYIYISERKLLKFLIIVGLACTIHFSAFLAFPLYWIYGLKIKYPIYILIGASIIAVFYVAGKAFLSDFSIFGPYVQYKLSHYMEAQESGEYFGGNMTAEMAMVNHVIKKSFVFLFLFLYCKKDIAVDKLFRGLTNMYLAGTIFYCSVTPIALQFARTSGYFDCVEIFICAYIFKTIKRRDMKLLFLFLIILMNFVRLHGHLDPQNPLIYNYHNVLFV